MLGNPLQYPRIPGKINLNMLRHREVLAGLIDEQEIADMPLAGGGIADVLTDRTDWWLRFLQSRDGSRLIGTENGFHLPGMPGSKPFYGFDRVTRDGSTYPNGDQALRLDLEDTLLRGDFHDANNDLTEDVLFPDNLGGRRAFELSNSGADYVDPNYQRTDGVTQPRTALTRHRVLSKVMNNTTTSSNVFLVILTIGHFETLIDANGAVRVGGEYDINHDLTVDEADRRKVMFVIDRSDIANAFDPGTGQFDWRRLVKEQVTIQ
jgi:hypothetical protein